MKRILVPTDFSEPSQASFRFAVELATKAQAEVFVVHIIELPFLPETTFGLQPYSFDPELINDLGRRAAEAFDQMKRKYSPGLRVSFHPIHDHIVPGIRMFVEQNDISIVIMSTHGASGLDEFIVGSTAEKIARSSPVPVIALPKEVEIDNIKNIVFPSALKLDQEEVMQGLKEMQQLLDAKLHILLINTPFKFCTDEQARTLLEKFAKHYALHNFTLNFRNHRSERSGILEFVDEIKADMIAMATQGRTGLAHFFQGSIAASVLNRVDQPIWIYKLRR
jgi:Universal stress protein UspA and related nucleotide-binding proteins